FPSPTSLLGSSGERRPTTDGHSIRRAPSRCCSPWRSGSGSRRPLSASGSTATTSSAQGGSGTLADSDFICADASRVDETQIVERSNDQASDPYGNSVRTLDPSRTREGGDRPQRLRARDQHLAGLLVADRTRAREGAEGRA